MFVDYVKVILLGVDLYYWKRYVEALIPSALDLAVFGNKVFVDTC
jgi:hypothetical protein